MSNNIFDERELARRVSIDGNNINSYNVDVDGQLILRTGLYKWSDGTIRDTIEPNRDRPDV